jgi:hypothetical protein
MLSRHSGISKVLLGVDEQFLQQTSCRSFIGVGKATFSALFRALPGIYVQEGACIELNNFQYAPVHAFLAAAACRNYATPHFNISRSYIGDDIWSVSALPMGMLTLDN